jgi:hypothetical protein
MKKQYLLLETARKIYQRLSKQTLRAPQYANDPELVADAIKQLLDDDKPCMIARLGANEATVVASYVGSQKYKGASHLISFIKGKTPRWWWTDKQLQSMETNAGFFNISEVRMTRFSKMMLDDMMQVDILGSWLPEESYFEGYLSQAKKVRLRYLEPFWSSIPWTAALEGKRVLVVHPFARTISRQYELRSELFDNPKTLPTFASLRIIKAVQSLGNDANGFKSWFDALEWMETEMDREDYDVALIGCGAYGFPLAAHAKRTGHKAVHLGGALQLLFGIKGRRWFSPDGEVYADYRHLLRPSWVSPDETERPEKANNVEGGCYW